MLQVHRTSGRRRHGQISYAHDEHYPRVGGLPTGIDARTNIAALNGTGDDDRSDSTKRFGYIKWVPGFPPETTTQSAVAARPGSLVLDRRLKCFIISTILLLTAGFTFLDYWAYSKVQHENPVAWERLASGQGIAPAQYRIGIYYTANALRHLTHLQFRHLFAASDFFCVLTGLVVVFLLLTRSPAFLSASASTQWAMTFLAFLLVQVYLFWSLWFQEPETMPSFAVVSSTVLLCSGLLRIPRAMLAVSILLLAALGSTIRVDTVIALHAGLFMAAFPLRDGARKWQSATSLLALMMAISIEHWLAHALFPTAPREVALIQIGANLKAWNGWLVLLISLPAWAITVWKAPKYWQTMDFWERGLLVGSAIHFVMFFTLGMTEEVRIFLPFALTLLSLTVPVLSAWLLDASTPLQSA